MQCKRQDTKMCSKSNRMFYGTIWIAILLAFVGLQSLQPTEAKVETIDLVMIAQQNRTITNDNEDNNNFNTTLNQLRAVTANQLEQEFEKLKAFIEGNDNRNAKLVAESILPTNLENINKRKLLLERLKRMLRNPNLLTPADQQLVPAGSRSITSILNDTIQLIMNRLTDLGFNSAGVHISCREKSICDTANFVINQMPQFVTEYGREKLNQLPNSILGNHEFTDAWFVGLSTLKDNFCADMYDCGSDGLLDALGKGIQNTGKQLLGNSIISANGIRKIANKQ